MTTALLTDQEVNDAIIAFGNYRTIRAQQLAAQGAPDGVSGSLLLALGLRETGLRNIRSHPPGATYLNQDVGWTQISETYHKADLDAMPGVKEGTWSPVVDGKSAASDGYVGRFTDECVVAIKLLDENQAYGSDHGVKSGDLVRFAVAAYNAGAGNALTGYRNGNVDEFTTGGDYSAWILSTRTQVNHWLAAHPGWEA